MAGLRLVAGLGNPGREYERTRHNAGFMVIDALAKRHGLLFAAAASWACHWSRWEDVLLVKPMTYMNRSGEALRAVGKFYKIPSAEMLVVVDDVALPLGRLRLRPRGSDGGHNGLRSIIAHLGEEFGRLRFGVGAADPGELLDHVLGRFSKAEEPVVARAVDRAADAVEHARTQGRTATMNLYKRAEEENTP